MFCLDRQLLSAWDGAVLPSLALSIDALLYMKQLKPLAMPRTHAYMAWELESDVGNALGRGPICECGEVH